MLGSKLQMASSSDLRAPGSRVMGLGWLGSGVEAGWLGAGSLGAGWPGGWLAGCLGLAGWWAGLGWARLGMEVFRPSPAFWGLLRPSPALRVRAARPEPLSMDPLASAWQDVAIGQQFQVSKAWHSVHGTGLDGIRAGLPGLRGGGWLARGWMALAGLGSAGGGGFPAVSSILQPSGAFSSLLGPSLAFSGLEGASGSP